MCCLVNGSRKTLEDGERPTSNEKRNWEAGRLESREQGEGQRTEDGRIRQSKKEYIICGYSDRMYVTECANEDRVMRERLNRAE